MFHVEHFTTMSGYDMMRVPMDYRETPWWRGLVRELGLAHSAVVLLNLWRELGYLARQGNLPGRLTSRDADMFLRELDRDGVPTEALLPQLEGCGLLTKGELPGVEWMCRPFVLANGQMTASALSSRGGEARAYRYRIEALTAVSAQLSLLISPSVLVDDQGQPLSPDLVERVRLIIALADSALAAKPRPAAEYSAGLVQSALAVARQYTDGQIRETCRKLYFARNHPALHGLVAEKLLARFTELATTSGALEEVGR